MNGLVLGLTGGIGSGKTAAADHFAQLGAAVVDSDAIAHELTRPGGAAMPAIAQAFGPAVIAPDGALDRAAMRQLVFADVGQRRQLESILHPLIRSARADRVKAAWESGAPYAIMVIPLLVEAGRRPDHINRVAVVDCPEAMQIERVKRRSGLGESVVRSIMAAQASRADRLEVADDIITNDGDLAHLHEQVATLHLNYCTLAAKIVHGG